MRARDCQFVKNTALQSATHATGGDALWARGVRSLALQSTTIAPYSANNSVVLAYTMPQTCERFPCATGHACRTGDGSLWGSARRAGIRV